MSLRNYGDSFLLVARTVQTIHFPRSCPIMLLPRSGCLLLIFIISVCRESAAVVARGMNSAGQTPAAPPCTKTPGSIKGGDLIILDVESLFAPKPFGLAGTDYHRMCVEACARTPGCNAYSYCDKESGCGIGCKAYSKDNPQLRAGPARSNGPDYDTPEPAWRKMTTITRFGPFGLTSACASVCATDSTTPGVRNCKPSDRWPFMMCSLKKVDGSKVVYDTSKAGDGWVSGTVQVPDGCGSLPFSTCNRCYNTDKSKAAPCLKCASDVTTQLPLIDQVYGTSRSAAASYCADCGKSTDPTKCVACLKDESCSGCLTSGLPLPDPVPCIDCVKKFGPAFVSACKACAGLGSADEVNKCLSCLDNMKPKACSPGGSKDGCWDPTAQAFSCVECASRTVNHTECVSCMESAPSSNACHSCTELPPGCQQSQCFECAGSTNSQGCMPCFRDYLAGYGFDTISFSQRQQCLSCVLDASVPPSAKEACIGCMQTCKTPEERARCTQCLATTTSLLVYSTANLVAPDCHCKQQH